MTNNVLADLSGPFMFTSLFANEYKLNVLTFLGEIPVLHTMYGNALAEWEVNA